MDPRIELQQKLDAPRIDRRVSRRALGVAGRSLLIWCAMVFAPVSLMGGETAWVTGIAVVLAAVPVHLWFSLKIAKLEIER